MINLHVSLPNKSYRFLEKLGFAFSRQSGSHKIYYHPDGRRVVVPMHSTVILKPKTLHSIQRDANLSNDELKSLL
ncbi:MAG: type II toxin-antitoxin system HicA family toxin [Ignavibacteria bacterium]|nr:type II toxin-antitoxin system HicA family toxin [Ignavibacteria bacterium]